MKVMVKFVTVAVLAMFLLVSQFGCYGSFALTKKVYEWNGKLGDKYLVQVAFWILNWLPVYSLAGTIDVVLLNLLEFWTGNNPLAMKSGDQIIKYAQNGDDSYKITMSKDNVKIEPMNSKEQGLELAFDHNTNAWYMNNGASQTKVATVDGNTMTLLYPDGRTMSLNLSN